MKKLFEMVIGINVILFIINFILAIIQHDWPNASGWFCAICWVFIAYINQR